MNAQLAAAFVPLSAAFVVAGGWYPSMIVISLLPLVLFIKSSSNRMKGIFRAEIAERNRSAMLAERLDTALNNMSHGLCMIDRQGRLILVNDKFHRIFCMPPEAELAGTHARAVFRRLVRNRSIDEASFVPCRTRFSARQAIIRISSCRSRLPTAGRSKSQFTR
jgi:PAS domain-containing protein